MVTADMRASPYGRAPCRHHARRHRQRPASDEQPAPLPQIKPRRAQRGASACYTAGACRRSSVLSARSDPAAAPARPYFHPWTTWLSTVLVALLVGYVFALTPSDPLDHLRWPEDSLERLAGRDMEMRAAMARAPRWERQLYAFLSGGEEERGRLGSWHEGWPGSRARRRGLDRLILLGEAGRAGSGARDVEEWEPDNEAATRRRSGSPPPISSRALPRHGCAHHRGAR
jgi:hypothetical protein